MRPRPTSTHMVGLTSVTLDAGIEVWCLPYVVVRRRATMEPRFMVANNLGRNILGIKDVRLRVDDPGNGTQIRNMVGVSRAWEHTTIACCMSSVSRSIGDERVQTLNRLLSVVMIKR